MTMNNAKKLSEKSVRVLSMIADGHSYSQNVNGNSDLNYHDIFQAAEEALQINESAEDYQSRLARIKSKYENAYEPWTEDADLALTDMCGRGESIGAMAALFQRQPSVIQSRIAKLGLTFQGGQRSPD